MVYKGDDVSKLTLGLKIANAIIEYSRTIDTMVEEDIYCITISEFEKFREKEMDASSKEEFEEFLDFKRALYDETDDKTEPLCGDI